MRIKTLMDKTDFYKELSIETGMTTAQVESLTQSFVEIITEKLVEGLNVNLNGFGLIENRMRQEKIAVHPSTGKKLLVPPKISLNFKPTNHLKQKLNDGKKDWNS